MVAPPVSTEGGMPASKQVHFDSLQQPGLAKINSHQHNDQIRSVSPTMPSRMQPQMRRSYERRFASQSQISSGGVSTQSRLFRKRQRELKELDKIMVKQTSIQKIMFLLRNFDFVALLLSLTSVYFITTGMQFWITDYWVQVLGQTKSSATIYFAIAAITGPVGGVILGGVVFSRLGGY